MPEHNQNHFENNLNQFSDNENTAENVNQQIENKASSRLQNEIGSKVLALVNFESKHKDTVPYCCFTFWFKHLVVIHGRY